MEDEEYMELDGNYCDEGGHYHPECAPDGKDLYDLYVELTMVPSFNEQMEKITQMGKKQVAQTKKCSIQLNRKDLLCAKEEALRKYQFCNCFVIVCSLKGE